ncbi:helix-turn-helix domain-containing protein [Zobellia uliginosa]|uniref:helix-turn-helix domain-containing protein n=1 Tax=Zobellia uliginosa TaxID=143224 RepID=UPI001C07D3FF|nr:helix-turn-helix domain-containing protein [Zobellia uliginosa]
MQSLQLIQISIEELQNLISEALDKRVKKNQSDKSLDKNFELLTRSEAAKFLKVDLSTLHQWTKKGKLISYGLGGRVYYKKKEIENALTKLN